MWHHLTARRAGKCREAHGYPVSNNRVCHAEGQCSRALATVDWSAWLEARRHIGGCYRDLDKGSGGLSWGHGNGQERRRQVLKLSISEMKRLAGSQGNSQPPHWGDWSSLRWDQGCWGSFREDGELSVASA